jgi:hypothetical protein
LVLDSQLNFAWITPRLTYRRRAGRWSAKIIFNYAFAAERKARAAVR